MRPKDPTTNRQGVRDLDALAREAAKPKAPPAPTVKVAPLGAMTACDWPSFETMSPPSPIETTIADSRFLAGEMNARYGGRAATILRIAAELLEVRR